MVLLWALIGCQEYQLHEPPKVPPAEPPGLPEQGYGGPPDWQDCQTGWLGRYANLSEDDPIATPAPEEVVETDPDALDWWSRVDFQRYESGLDFGENWWPVDDGLAGDPAYFTASFVAWLRAWDDTTVSILFASSDDGWVDLDGEVVISEPGVHPFVQRTYDVPVDSGQYPIQVRYAHRAGGNGLRFRIVSGDVSVCYPDFSQE